MEERSWSVVTSACPVVSELRDCRRAALATTHPGALCQVCSLNPGCACQAYGASKARAFKSVCMYVPRYRRVERCPVPRLRGCDSCFAVLVHAQRLTAYLSQSIHVFWSGL